MKNILFSLVMIVSLSACKYSNEFQGTLNDAPAMMSAYSKNIKKYCIALEIKSGGVTLESYVSAQSLIDSDDVLKNRTFNTKGSDCNANEDQYLVGSRDTRIVNINKKTEMAQVGGPGFCRMKTYKEYQYLEEVSFDLKNNSNDETIASFSGTGKLQTFTDHAHPDSVGPYFICGNTHGNSYAPSH